MTLLFISDLHLSEQRPAITRAFFDFLRTDAAQADALYILGDLVEAWIGDDDPGPLAAELKKALANLTAGGTRIFFLHGNRDFLIGKHFAEQTGCTLLPDYHLIEQSGQRILLCHGDTLCLDDINYQKFRRKVRNPIYRWLLAHLPLKKRQQIAREWRLKSTTANNNKAENIMDVSTSEVERVMAQHRATLLIHGHTHRPGIHTHSQGERIVLGDWDKKGWYVRMDKNAIQLTDFVIAGGTPEIAVESSKTDAELHQLAGTSITSSIPTKSAETASAANIEQEPTSEKPIENEVADEQQTLQPGDLKNEKPRKDASENNKTSGQLPLDL